MTEAPKIGFLCTGKTPLELAISIHCQSKMSTVLKEAGYDVGGCYTEIFDGSGPEKIKRAGKTLEYLCRSNQAVLTLGCEGFSAGDVIPELTDAVCTGSASYFTSVLCGAKELLADMPLGFSPANSRERLYSDDDRPESFRPRTLHTDRAEAMPFAEKLRKALRKIDRQKLADFSADGSENSAIPPSDTTPSRMSAGSAMRIFAGQAGRSDDWRQKRFCEHEQNSLHETELPSAHAIKIPPSRAHAGLLGQALLLNFSNDVASALPLLETLLPAIGFSVYNLSGKSAASCAEFEKKLKKIAKIEDFHEIKHAVNG